MRHAILIAAVASLLTAVAATPLSAQDNAFQFRMGGFFPSGDGEFWGETEDAFRFEVSDLDSWVGGVTYTRSVNRHVDLGMNFDLYSGWTPTSYRDWVDFDGFAIVHDTRLTMYPVSVDLRLVPTGRRVAIGRDGRRAPRPAFYLGGGLGANFWTYEEIGDFIDFNDPVLPIVTGQFVDSGVAFQAHALAGLEIPLGQRWSFLTEAKYTWSEATLGPGIPVDTTEIDLGGFAVSFGATVRF